jgi:hypothetical protein
VNLVVRFDKSDKEDDERDSKVMAVSVAAQEAVEVLLSNLLGCPLRRFTREGRLLLPLRRQVRRPQWW